MRNRVNPIAPGMYLIADIKDSITRNQLIKDGYGYCIKTASRDFIRVEIIPDSEFYTEVRAASREEVKRWYESFDALEAYEDMLTFYELP